MSHSPLLNLPGPSQDLLDDINTALADARQFVRAYDPELVVIFSPDHYNGFFYRVMPPFCIGTNAVGVGDFGTQAGPLNVPGDIATDCATAVLDAGVDVAISASMDVDHGTVQPLQTLFGDAAATPVVPIFINSVATPLGPLKRTRALGAAVGRFVATLDKRVLLLGSGGLSHDPPVPTLATAPSSALGRIVDGEPMTPEQRQARQTAVIGLAQEFAHGRGGHFDITSRRKNGRTRQSMIGKPRNEAHVEVIEPGRLRVRLSIAEQGMWWGAALLAGRLRGFVPKALALPGISGQSQRPRRSRVERRPSNGCAVFIQRPKPTQHRRPLILAPAQRSHADGLRFLRVDDLP